MADGVSKEAGEAQRALVQVRTQHSDLCAEQEKIRYMKQEYIAQLKRRPKTAKTICNNPHSCGVL